MASYLPCAYCGKPTEGNFSLDMYDAFDSAEPDIDLCNHCGGCPEEEISVAEIRTRVETYGRPDPPSRPTVLVIGGTAWRF